MSLVKTGLLVLSIIVLSSTGLVHAAQSVEAPEVLSNDFSKPEYKERFQVLVEDLRCTMCQNQNIQDSNASIARDMRRIVYEQIENGKTDDEITQYLVDRYGKFVLYNPPFRGIDVVIWLAPFFFLISGLIILVLFIKNRQLKAPAMDQTNKEALKDALSHINDEIDSQEK